MEIRHVTTEGNHMPDYIKQEVECAMNYAQAIIDDGEEVEIVAVAYSPKKGMAFIHVANLPSKIVIAETIRHIALQHEATMVMLLSEGYTLPQHLIKAQMDGATGYASIKDHPEHFEVLVLSIESVDGNWIGQAVFNGTGKDRTIGPIEFHENLAEDSKGNLMNLLPRKSETGQTVDAMISIMPFASAVH